MYAGGRLLSEPVHIRCCTQGASIYPPPLELMWSILWSHRHSDTRPHIQGMAARSKLRRDGSDPGRHPET
jgi:hypothetical protein